MIKLNKYIIYNISNDKYLNSLKMDDQPSTFSISSGNDSLKITLNNEIDPDKKFFSAKTLLRLQFCL